MGILDNGFLLGLETNYGVPAPLTNAYEITADQWQLRREDIPSAGMRAGMAADRVDRATNVDLGGEGSAPLEMLDKGMGPILAALLGGFTGPTLVPGSTLAYQMTATATADPSDRSFTAQILRNDASTPSVQTAFTHPGAVVTGWEFSHQVGGNLALNVDFSSAEILRSDQPGGTPAGVPQYTDDARTLNWTRCGVKVGDISPVANFQCTQSFSLAAALGLKVDRRCMRQDARTKRAIRNALPQYTGTIEAEYFANYVYDLYRDDTPIPIMAEWVGREIETGFNHILRITMPDCKITGDATPKGNNDIPMQSIPFKAYEGATAPVVIEYITTDATL